MEAYTYTYRTCIQAEILCVWMDMDGCRMCTYGWMPYVYVLCVYALYMPGPDGTDVLEKIGASFGSAIRSQTSKFGKENGTPQSIPNEMSRSV